MWCVLCFRCRVPVLDPDGWLGVNVVCAVFLLQVPVLDPDGWLGVNVVCAVFDARSQF